MNYLVFIYIFLYLLHVIFGHSIIPRFIFGDEIPFPPIPSEIIRRAFFITYLSILSIAYFLNYKTKESYFVAISLSMASLLGYIIKYYGKELTFPPNGNYYLTSIIEHVLIMLPLLMYTEYFPSEPIYFVVLFGFLGFYSLFYEILYNY